MLVCLRSQNVSSKVVFMESQEHGQPADIVSAMSDNKDIRSLIYIVRGQQVMMDSDLADLKNSTYLRPQWWQTIAKQVHCHSFPTSSRTFTKPQSIWNISSAPLSYLSPLLAFSTARTLGAGTRSPWLLT